MNIKTLVFSLLAAGIATSAYAVDIQRWQTDAGTQIVLVERHELPIVDYAVVFKGAGSTAEPEGKSDIASSTAAMMLRGTADLNEEQFMEKATNLSTHMEGSSSPEYSMMSFRSLSRADALDETAKLFGQAVSAPRFDAAVLIRLQNQAVVSLKQSQAYPGYLTQREYTRLNYGSHPYGKSANRSEQSIRAVQLGDIEQFHRQYYAQDNAIVLLVGDVNRDGAEKLVRQTLGQLPAHAARHAATPPVNVEGGKIRRLPFAHSEQASIKIGLPVLKYDDPDYFPLMVGNYVLGAGGFDSRLMKVLRDKHGYTYGATSSFVAYEQKGPFTISFTTKRENSEKALQAAQQVLAAFVAEGPTAEELKQAQDNMTGSFPLNFDSNAKLIHMLVGVAVHNRPNDWLDTYPAKIRAVTAEDVRRAWQKHIQPKQMNVVVTGGVSSSK